MINIEQHPSSSQKMPLLSLAFRPFFLLAALFSIVATLIWFGIYIFHWAVPLNTTALTWHGHEMVYGYSLAVIAGFLLTAIKNWTQIPTLNGAPLGMLVLLWLLSRIVTFFPSDFALALAAAFDSLFIAHFLIAAAIPIIKVRQWQQLGIITILFLLLISNGLYYAGLLGYLPHGVSWGLYFGLYLILGLIFVMARRVIPFFIEKGVGYPVQLKNRKWLDVVSLVVYSLFCILDVFAPNQFGASLLAGILVLLHSMRMQAWYTHGIWEKPLLWVLYLAYGALVVGFALKVAVYALDISPYLALHAFAFAGIGLMTIGMMSRVSLGHTGRNVFDPPPILFWVFALLVMGAVFRVLFPLITDTYYTLWIAISQLLWIGAFSLFVVVFFPVLTKESLTN